MSLGGIKVLFVGKTIQQVFIHGNCVEITNNDGGAGFVKYGLISCEN